MQQKASKVLMIRPVKFGFNEQTAGSNSFQQTAALEALCCIEANLVRNGLFVRIY